MLSRAKTEAHKLYSSVFWILLNIIKIDPYNFELYRFEVDTFFWDTVQKVQKPISYRYSSCRCCCSFSSLWGDVLKKAKGSVVSNWIGLKHCRNVLHENTQRMTVKFLIWLYNFKMAAMTSFHAEVLYCHTVSKNEDCAGRMQQRTPVHDILVF